jgi:hypothetical protein
MIQQQQTLIVSPYIELYNLIVPKDNDVTGKEKGKKKQLPPQFSCEVCGGGMYPQYYKDVHGYEYRLVYGIKKITMVGGALYSFHLIF